MVKVPLEFMVFRFKELLDKGTIEFIFYTVVFKFYNSKLRNKKAEIRRK